MLPSVHIALPLLSHAPVRSLETPQAMKTLLQTVRVLSASLLCLTAAACNSKSDSITGTAGGASFNATITGASAGSFTGIASASTIGGIQNITLGTTDTKFALSFTRSGSKFTVGTFTLGDNLLIQYIAALSINNGGALYGSTGGTFTITSATSTSIKGSFDFQGKLNNGTTTNAVKGDFVAMCAIGC